MAAGKDNMLSVLNCLELGKLEEQDFSIFLSITGQNFKMVLQ